MPRAGMTGPVILGRAGRAPLPQNKKAGDQGIFPLVPGLCFSLPAPRYTFLAGTRYSATKWSAWFC